MMAKKTKTKNKSPPKFNEPKLMTFQRLACNDSGYVNPALEVVDLQTLMKMK